MGGNVNDGNVNENPKPIETKKKQKQRIAHNGRSKKICRTKEGQKKKIARFRERAWRSPTMTRKSDLCVAASSALSSSAAQLTRTNANAEALRTKKKNE